MGKKQSKVTMNSGDGFVSVAYDSGRDSVIIKDFAPPEHFEIHQRALMHSKNRPAHRALRSALAELRR
jgi:hypothetical protein